MDRAGKPANDRKSQINALLDSQPESIEEKLGVWALVIMDDARQIKVSPRSEKALPGGELLLTKDGAIERPNKKYIAHDLTPEKQGPSQIQIRYEGKALNFKQIETLQQVEKYAKFSGQGFSLPAHDVFAWQLVKNFPQRLQKSRSIFSDKLEQPSWPSATDNTFGSGKVLKQRPIEESLGLTRLPEGLLAPKRVAEAIRRAEIDAGFNIDVTSAIRSPAKQERLYRELRDKQDVAPPGSSYHDIGRGGIAIDVANWSRAKPYLERQGFVHGEPGRGPLWNDPWHFVFAK
ncbi:MAG: M15 family metallopeptidase [Candidatus Melainabacteria bacterium]|nr:M15 family metallopeptidase [Candidatus Melainabacteria bacterium]